MFNSKSLMQLSFQDWSLARSACLPFGAFNGESIFHGVWSRGTHLKYRRSSLANGTQGWQRCQTFNFKLKFLDCQRWFLRAPDWSKARQATLWKFHSIFSVMTKHQFSSGVVHRFIWQPLTLKWLPAGYFVGGEGYNCKWWKLSLMNMELFILSQNFPRTRACSAALN